MPACLPAAAAAAPAGYLGGAHVSLPANAAAAVCAVAVHTPLATAAVAVPTHRRIQLIIISASVATRPGMYCRT